jgi:hypothetical protein
MKKGILTTFVLLLLSSVVSMAQWVNQGAWPDSTVRGQLHGIAVDPAGKVWAGNFSPEKFLPPGGGPTDSVTANLIRVYNPDGTPASFSPVWKVEGNGINDTLKGSNVRGMRADHNGNILIVFGNQNMYRINYQTGAGMNKVALGLGTSPTAPGVSSTGQIFVGPVVMAGAPIKEFDADFNLVGNAVAPFSFAGFSRTMICSADGNTLYFPSYTLRTILVYQRPDELSAFDSIGTIMDSIVCESMAFNPATGHLWVSGGTYFTGYPQPVGYTQNTWYAYNLSTNTIVDSLKWQFNVPLSENERPRGIDFSPDGSIAYLGVFGQASDLVQKVVNTGSDVDDQGHTVVNGYALSQNYPNPFNPTTKINFELVAPGYTTLKVYDMLGNEVATLVQNELTTGTHSVNFNAANLASGTYVYQLNVNGTRITNKMVLLK